MEGKYIAGIMAVVVSVILVGSVLFPIIESSSGGTPAWDETITTTYNEDPDLQFDKQTSDFALNMSVTIGDDVVITNGTDTITSPYGAMFLLAADNSAIFINTSDDLIFTWSDNVGRYSLTLEGDFTAVIADGKLTINDGTAHDAPLPASYLYVPSSTGGYGSFASGELAKRAEDPVIAAGSFAGAVGYNSSVSYVGDAMIMSVDGTDTLVNSVEWVAAPEAEPSLDPFDPSTITIQPLDPSVLDPEPDASIMTVPTPSYTDGEWGYNLVASGEHQGKAIIVSYSGAGGTIVVPSTVNGIDVVFVGAGGTDQTIFDPSLGVDDIIISDGIIGISANAFKDCVGITGSVILPRTLTSIGTYAFRGCTNITGVLNIPDGVTRIDASAFSYCSGFDTLVIPSSLVTIATYVFYQAAFNNLISFAPSNMSMSDIAFTNATTFNQILDLGEYDWASKPIAANAEIGSDITSSCYIAPATITEVIHHPGTGGGGSLSEYSALLEAMGLFVIIGILLAAVGLFITMRQF